MTELGFWELGALDWIRTVFSSSLMDRGMEAISFLGEGGWIFIVLGLILLCFPKTRRVGMVVLLSLLLSGLIVNLALKPLVGRLRPYVLNPAARLIAAPPTDASFPSGHTSAAFAFFFSVLGRSRRLSVGAGLFAVLMAFSRLYLYVHFPSDIVAGILSGLLCALLSRALWKWARARFSKLNQW